MILYNIPRGTGKTTRLIYLSEYLQVPILTRDYGGARYIQGLAEAMMVQIPPPIVSYSLFCKGWRDVPVLVDEFPQVAIEWFSRAGLNICQSNSVRVLAATMTIDDLSEELKRRFSRLIGRNCEELPKGVFKIDEEEISGTDEGVSEETEVKVEESFCEEVVIEKEFDENEPFN